MVKLRLLFLTTQEDKAEKNIMISCSNNSSLKKCKKKKKPSKHCAPFVQLLNWLSKWCSCPEWGSLTFSLYIHTHIYTLTNSAPGQVTSCKRYKNTKQKTDTE